MRRLKFLDEASVNRDLTRRYGRAPHGERVRETVPFRAGTPLTMLATLDWQGLGATMAVSGALDRTVLDLFIRQAVVPTLQPGDIVVLDNPPVHRGPALQAAVRAVGAKVLFLPPYSSDLNPIELCWSKVKTILRSLKARTTEALLPAMTIAFEAITPTDVQAWFAHCGYPVHPI